MNRTCPPTCTCDCCTGVEQRTPLSIANAVGLAALSYRVGVYGDFFSSMLARLATMDVALDPTAAGSSLGRILSGKVNPAANASPTPLAALTTRALDDPTIAFLDAWAVVLDVLTFYQERLANEGFLRTATEPLSVRELARLVGYTPSPGVASSVFLAYTLEQGGPVTIPAGSRATSTPGPGQQPQSFETSADLLADPRWNAPLPRQMRPQDLEPGQTTAGKRLFFAGLTTQLQPNDPLVLVFDAGPGEPFRGKKVTPDNPNQRTTVVLQDFTTVPVLIDTATALQVAATGITAAIGAYHDAEPIQIGATIRVIAAVRKAVAPLLGVPPPDPIHAALLTAIQDLNTQKSLVQQLKNSLVQLDAVAAAVEQLIDALKAITAIDPTTVQAQVGQGLTAFTSAVGLNAAYQDAAVANLQTIDALAKAIEPAAKGLGAIEDVLNELRGDLIRLRGVEATLPPGPPLPLGVRLDGLIARLESAEDRLALQDVAVGMNAFQNPNPAAPDISSILDKWTAEKIKDLSPVNLANSLEDSLNALDLALETPNADPDAIAKVRAAATGFLFRALAPILRQILNRFYYVQQAGIAADTKLATAALKCFGDLRNILNPTADIDNVVARLLGDLGKQALALGADMDLQPLDDLQRQLQTALDSYRRTIDLRKLNNSAADALGAFNTAQANFVAFLGKITSAVTTYLKSLPPPPEQGEVHMATHVVAFPDPLDTLKTAVANLVLTPNLDDWTKGRLSDLQAAATGNDPEADVTAFAPKFASDVQTIKQAFATVTANAAALLDFLPGSAGVADLLGKAQALLIDLRRDQRVAQAGQYPRVGPWLDQLVEALEQFSSDLAQKVPPSAAQAQADLQREQSGSPTVPLDGTNLPDLGSLSKAASQPPASPAQLQRRLAPSTGNATNDSSASFLDDLAPQLAVAFNPNLGDNLYTALANTITRRTRRFQGVYVLRARSAPFGHNAPPRTIFGLAGGVVGTAEWPLAPERATIRVFPVSAGMKAGTSFTGTAVEVAFETPTRTYESYFNLTGNGSVRAGDTAMTLDWTIDASTLTIHLPSTNLANLKLALSKGTVSVTQTGSGNPVTLDCDETKDNTNLATDGSYLTASYNNLQNPGVLSVVSEIATGLPGSRRNVLQLDITNDRVVPGGYVIIQRADNTPPKVARIEAVATVSPKAYGLTGTVTQLTLDQAWLGLGDTTLASLRDVTVYVQSEELVLSGEPFDADLGGALLELDDVVPGLKPGRWLIVAGERTDVPGVSGVQAAELVMLASASQVVDAAGGDGQGDPHTLLHLAAPLAYTYQRATTTIWANVVKATQGETRSEILGSGNPAVADQSFRLKQGPLTFLPAPIPSGAGPALQVRVNGVLWDPTDEPLAAGPTDRTYFLTLDAAGANVVFGDGVNGARPSAGSDNIRALYRIGLGQNGNVPAGKVNQLATRPLGVKAVVNPLAASGGANPESTASARRNAAVGVTAMGRLVSVDDYADFARGFPGIEKAYATRISDGFVTRVHLTLAGQDGDALDPQADNYRNLVLSLRRYGDPGLPFVVAARRMRFIVFAGSLRIDPAYQFTDVVPQALALFNDAYGYDRRDFAEDVVLSALVALLQSVEGVVAVRADGFGLVDERAADEDENPAPTPLDQLAAQIATIATTQPVPPVLPVSGTRRGGKGIRAAEIAVLSPRVPQTLILNEWTS